MCGILGGFVSSISGRFSGWNHLASFFTGFLRGCAVRFGFAMLCCSFCEAPLWNLVPMHLGWAAGMLSRPNHIGKTVQQVQNCWQLWLRCWAAAIKAEREISTSSMFHFFDWTALPICNDSTMGRDNMPPKHSMLGWEKGRTPARLHPLCLLVSRTSPAQNWTSLRRHDTRGSIWAWSPISNARTHGICSQCLVYQDEHEQATLWWQIWMSRQRDHYEHNNTNNMIKKQHKEYQKQHHKRLLGDRARITLWNPRKSHTLPKELQNETNDY